MALDASPSLAQVGDGAMRLHQAAWTRVAAATSVWWIAAFGMLVAVKRERDQKLWLTALSNVAALLFVAPVAGVAPASLGGRRGRAWWQ